MFMEIQDKSIVMSSPIRLSKILVYICLHEKNGKNAFSKIGFRLGELSDWKVFIVGYTFMEIQDKCIVMSSVVENFGLHLPTREKREKGVFKNQIPLRKLSDWKVFIVGYMFMESQDKSIVMSSPIRLSKILVYIRLHEKNGKKTFSKIGFHSDWKVFIVGYQDTCSWKAKISVLLCHRLSKSFNKHNGKGKEFVPWRQGNSL